jgi:hypothetical protein
MPNLRKVFDKYNKKIAQLAGQNFALKRPDYSVVDNTPATVLSSVKFKVEVAPPRLSQETFINVSYYTIFGDRKLLRAGDILFPLETTESTTPPVTVLNFSPIEECMGFRTSRVGKLTYDIDTNVYTTVYFDWVGSGYPGSSFQETLSGALAIPTKKAVLFTRTSIKPQSNSNEVQGMRLIETDGTTEVRWVVKLVDQIGNLTQLTLEQEH